MVGELRGMLVPVVGYASACHSVGDNGAGVGGLLQSLLPFGCSCGVLCRVRLFLFMGLFVWWCVLRPIMYQFCFFLNDIAVLLL
jgi:hypothetical protein